MPWLPLLDDQLLWPGGFDPEPGRPQAVERWWLKAEPDTRVSWSFPAQQFKKMAEEHDKEGHKEDAAAFYKQVRLRRARPPMRAGGSVRCPCPAGGGGGGGSGPSALCWYGAHSQQPHHDDAPCS